MRNRQLEEVTPLREPKIFVKFFSQRDTDQAPPISPHHNGGGAVGADTEGALPLAAIPLSCLPK